MGAQKTIRLQAPGGARRPRIPSALVGTSQFGDDNEDSDLSDLSEFENETTLHGEDDDSTNGDTRNSLNLDEMLVVAQPKYDDVGVLAVNRRGADESSNF